MGHHEPLVGVIASFTKNAKSGRKGEFRGRFALRSGWRSSEPRTAYGWTWTSGMRSPSAAMSSLWGGGTAGSQGRCTSKIWRDHGWKAGCGAKEEPGDNRSADIVAVELNTCQPERLSQRGRYLRATSPSKYGHCTEICVVCVTKDAQ